MGTLTGAPKIKAMQLIYQFEQQKRHSYGGAVGYHKFKIRGREDWRDTLMSGVGYQDKSSEQIERDIITVVDREIQQAVRGK